MIYQRLCETAMFWQTPQSYSQISVLGCLSFPTKPSEFAGPHADLWKQAVVNTWTELGPSDSLPTLPLLLLGSSHTPFSELLGGPHSWVSWSQCTAANPHLGHTVTSPPHKVRVHLQLSYPTPVLQDAFHEPEKQSGPRWDALKAMAVI